MLSKYTLTFLLFHIIVSNSLAVKVLNRGNGSEVDSLNIHQAQGLNSQNVLRDMYEGLMTLNAEGEPIYGAAESHVINNNTLTFQLRKDGHWSDGRPVTADDFVRAWRLALDPSTAAPYAFLLTNIRNGKEILEGRLSADQLGVTALSSHELEIELLATDHDFLEKLSLPVFFPLPANHQDNSQISNGCYSLSQRVLQEKIVLKKNRYHPDVEKVFFDQVVYWVTENQSSELKRFRAGELDITESVPDSQMPWLRENMSEQLRVHPYLGSFFLGLNLNHSQLQNIHLRKALFYAIDRDILVSKVLKSGQIPAYHIVPSTLLKSETITIQRSKQIELAKKHLKDSGLKPHQVNLQILYNNSQNQKKVALAVAAMWRQSLGIKSQLKAQEWKMFTQTRKTDNKQVFRSGWIADYMGAMSFLELFESTSRFNFYAYKSERFDDLIRQANSSANAQIYFQHLSKAQSLLLEELPVLPLYYYVSRHMVSSQIKGFKDNISDRHLSRYLYNTGL